MLSLLLLLGIFSSSENLRNNQQVVEGWLVERLFHAEEISCPWTDDPANDVECLDRISRITTLQNAIAVCPNPFQKTLRSISHRGAALIAPEETEISNDLAIKQGSGFLECDAAYTKDEQFVCRHSTCDLHTTTDILANHPELIPNCSVPFTPAEGRKKATVECCTYDFTVEQLKSLCGIMDSNVNSSATSPTEYLIGPPAFRTNAFTASCHPVITFTDFLGYARLRKMNAIPELKDTTSAGLNFFLTSIGKNYTDISRQFANEVEKAGFTFPLGSSRRVGVLQTFDRRVASLWGKEYPVLTSQYMWTTKTCLIPTDCGSFEVIEELIQDGVDIFSPQMKNFLDSKGHTMVESEYSKQLRLLVMDRAYLGSWSLERSGCTNSPTAQVQPGTIGTCGGYYSTVEGVSAFQEVDVLVAMDVLFKEAGIIGLFSDFPGTVSAYSNCVLGPDLDSSSSLLSISWGFVLLSFSFSFLFS